MTNRFVHGVGAGIRITKFRPQPRFEEKRKKLDDLKKKRIFEALEALKLPVVPDRFDLRPEGLDHSIRVEGKLRMTFSVAETALDRFATILDLIQDEGIDFTDPENDPVDGMF